VAFPSVGWDDADALRAALWADPKSAAILDAVSAAVAANLPEAITGQRKTFTAWSRNFQFAALKPVAEPPCSVWRSAPTPARASRRRGTKAGPSA
jgi:hypothetical protein